MNCEHCQTVYDLDVNRDGRGYNKQEVLELIWMIYPPKATGLDPYRRSTWMKAAITGNDLSDPTESLTEGVQNKFIYSLP